MPGTQLRTSTSAFVESSAKDSLIRIQKALTLQPPMPHPCGPEQSKTTSTVSGFGWVASRLAVIAAVMMPWKYRPSPSRPSEVGLLLYVTLSVKPGGDRTPGAGGFATIDWKS